MPPYYCPRDGAFARRARRSNDERRRRCDRASQNRPLVRFKLFSPRPVTSWRTELLSRSRNSETDEWYARSVSRVHSAECARSVIRLNLRTPFEHCRILIPHEQCLLDRFENIVVQ